MPHSLRSRWQLTRRTSPRPLKSAHIGVDLRTASVPSDVASLPPARNQIETHQEELPVRSVCETYETIHTERRRTHRIPVQTSAKSLEMAPSGLGEQPPSRSHRWQALPFQTLSSRPRESLPCSFSVSAPTCSYS